MAERDGPMREVLDRYAQFLQDKNLAMEKHRPHPVRGVREFLRLARARTGYSFEQTLDLFMAEVGGRVQNRDRFSMRRTRYASTATRAKAEGGDAPTAQVFVAYAKRCFQLGASGFVSKEAPIGHVQEAIRCVMRGYGYVSERLADAVMREAAQTPRT